MEKYDHLNIEAKWQKIWENKKAFEAKDDAKKTKFYGLIEFPYPSGDGLHVGHPRPYIGMDVICRKRRMEGFNVLYPIGWDAFGLPTENYAIKTGISPVEATKKNTDTFRRQIKSLAISFDWSREINTTDPKYYKWTQWIFLKFFEKGLAYKKKMTINWCPKDKIGLANEEVVNGCCERCGTPVEKREKEQWMLAITKYAERLDKDLDTVNFQERIKTQQRNWIGRSEGAELEFQIQGSNKKIKIFTTRPDTLFGVTYLVLAPESDYVSELKSQIQNWPEVEKYITQVKNKTEIERTAEEKDKSGIELKGVKVINPANKEEVPVWIADYVLAQYGTGAVMAVPAHDERDFAFAKKYKLSVKRVIDDTSGAGNVPKEFRDNPTEFFKTMTAKDFCFTGQGKLMNSGKFDGLNNEEAKKKITEFAGGNMVTTFKLRDWVFSRQRYWGEPIPMVHCEKDGWVPVPEKELPLVLPEVKKYEPTDTGESPLALITDWVNTKCPKCGGPGKRETDTMPNWAGSSWYYLRYVDPHNDKEFASMKNLKYWTPVDWYNGGMEHTTLHLLYSRFWHKFLFDLKLVPTSEPYMKRTSHGLILGEGGEKMSKSRGNVINPDTIVKNVGADSLRLYEMFMGPFDQPIAWNTESIAGTRRFIEKIWNLKEKVSDKAKDNSEIESLVQKTIKKVSDDIEMMGFNTAISAMMILVNTLEKEEKISKESYLSLVKLLSPFAPHISEEIWQELGGKGLIMQEAWPKFDEAKVSSAKVKIAIQVSGKARGVVEMPARASQSDVEKAALALPEISKWTEGKKILKTIFVPDRIINFVLGE
jgi:leucyl-tRNA synthetase